MTLDVAAPLSVRLQTIQARIEREYPMLTAPIDAFLARLQAARAGNAAPQVGEVLPDVVLPDLDGRLQRLHAVAAQGPLVVSFLRGHWCPYCKTFASALAETPLPRGARLLFITPDRAAFAKALAAEAGTPGPVLIDVDNGYALTLGLAVWMDPVFAERMAAADADLAASQGTNLSTVPIPATFVIDRRGVVRARHVEPNYRERMALEDIMAVLQAID